MSNKFAEFTDALSAARCGLSRTSKWTTKAVLILVIGLASGILTVVTAR